LTLKSSKKNQYAYVSVAGLVGCGKTTAVNLLAEKLGFHLFEEKVKENKFLPLFYQDARRWAFQSQLFYLKEKASQLVKIKKIINETNVIQDVPLSQDCLVYAKAQQILGNMNKDEFALYEKFFHMLNREAPEPHFIIQLNASVPVIMQRIKLRGRDYEKSISPEYITLLLKLQNEWLGNYPKSKLVVVDTDTLDIVSNPKHQDQFIEIVKSRLADFL